MADSNRRLVFNPFLPLHEYVPDGEPHVFGDRIYLFGSHDQEGGDAYCLLDYVGYSAPVNDLSDWRCEGIIYKAEQDPDYSETRRYIYAPDVVRGLDGRYYLYYCLVGGDNYISVAVCDSPAGRYEYYGYVRNVDGSVFKRFVPGDPAVINDNGIIRLYFGWSLALPDDPVAAGFGPLTGDMTEQLIAVQMMLFGKSREEITGEPDGVMGANTVILASDMLTIASEPVRIVPGQFSAQETSFAGHAFYEGSSIRKIGETYYFVYSSQRNHELCYATSKFPDKDFVFGGTIISNCDIGLHGRLPQDSLNLAGTNHGSIECVNGRWYVFYHRLTHASDYSRQACAEPIEILADGSIPQVGVSSSGLYGEPLPAIGDYPAVIACHITDGKMPNLQFDRIKIARGIPHVTHAGDERYITGIKQGTLIGYKYFKFDNPVRLSILVRGSGTGELMVSGQSGTLGQLTLSPAKDWQVLSTDLDVRGVEPLDLTYQGEGEFDLLTIRFEPLLF